MKTIHRFPNLAEAGFAQSLLEAAGIEATLTDDFAATSGPLLVGVHLSVQDTDAYRAWDILDRQGCLDSQSPAVAPEESAPAEHQEAPPVAQTKVLDITCPTCGTEWELTPAEASARSFTCDQCKSTFMIIDIMDIKDAWKTVEGFVYPDWRVIGEYIKLNYPLSEHSAIWRQASLQWVGAIRDALGSEYKIHQSENFVILTTKTPNNAKFLLNVCENALTKIRAILGALAWHWTNGKHVVLMFEDLELYYGYISHFYPDKGEFSGSGGIFIHRGYCHTALPPSRDAVPALIHELTHLSLVQLRIPLWLNEGLAMNTEDDVNGRNLIRLDKEMIALHEAHWNAETIQDFWSGKSFSQPDASKMSYSLAQILVENLQSDYPNLEDFIKEAKASDAGESSARQHLGVSLSVVASTFLGEGDWTPKPPHL
jgi:hypothetical protein